MIDNKTTFDILCKVIAVGIAAYRVHLFIVGMILFYTKARIAEEFNADFGPRIRAHTAWYIASYVLYNIISWTWR